MSVTQLVKYTNTDTQTHLQKYEYTNASLLNLRSLNYMLLGHKPLNWFEILDVSTQIQWGAQSRELGHINVEIDVETSR